MTGLLLLQALLIPYLTLTLRSGALCLVNQPTTTLKMIRKVHCPTTMRQCTNRRLIEGSTQPVGWTSSITNGSSRSFLFPVGMITTTTTQDILFLVMMDLKGRSLKEHLQGTLLHMTICVQMAI